MTALSDQVLVLNRNFEADKIVSARAALCLLVRGRAEVVDVEQTPLDTRFLTYDFASWQELAEFQAEFEKDKHRWVRSAKMSVAVPTIVRLRDYAQFRKRQVKLNRHNLFARDGHRCQYCGKKFKPADLTIDHVIPKSRGGKLEWSNVTCACVRCNMRKANRTPHEAGMKLIRKPEKPKYQFPIPKVKHATWAHFVDMAYWCTELLD